MLSTVTGILTQATLLVLLCTALFWAVVGAATASRMGRPVLASAALSGLLPVLGTALVLVLADRRPPVPGRVAPPRDSFSSAGPPAPASLYAPPTSPYAPPPPATGYARAMGYGSSGSVADYLPPGSSDYLSPGSSDYLPPGSQVVHQPPAASRGGSTRLSPAAVGGGSVVAALIALPALVAAVLLLLCLPRPWVQVRAQGLLEESFQGDGSMLTGLSVVLGAIALVVAALGFNRRPAGRWVVLGAASSTVWLLVGLELLLVTDAAEALARRLSTVAQRQASVDGGSGAHLLVVAGLLGLNWCVAALWVLVQGRRTKLPTGQSASPRSTGW